MAYRKIIVDGIEFGYIIGKAAVKVKGPGGSFIVPRATLLRISDAEYKRRLDWHGQHCDHADDHFCDGGPGEDLAITPKMIAAWIRAPGA